MTRSPYSFSRLWPLYMVACVHFLANPGTIVAQRALGIDVSSFQDYVNWTNVQSSGITFAWAKATQGNYYVDAQFPRNEVNGKAAGVYIGAYDFADYNSLPGTNGAVTEANFFWSEVRPYLTTGALNLMPALDVELIPTNTTGAASAVSTWVNQWCNRIVALGAASGITVQPVVYTYESFSTSYLNGSVTEWPLWMASDASDPQTGAPNGNGPWSTWTFWQYGEGTISGITNGECDVDVFNGTASQLTPYIIGASTNPPTPYAPAGATIYWDPLAARTTPGSGGGGNWDTATADWWLGGSTNVVWSPQGNNAVFAGTAGTVALASAVTADSVTFSAPGYTVSGSGVLTLTGTGSVFVPPGSPTYIDCVLGGVAYNLSGGGVMVLNNAGNYSTGETVTGPNTTVVVPTDHPLGNDGVTLNLTQGGIYQDNDTTSGDEFLLPGCAVALLAGGGIFDNPNANLTMSNYITGSGSLTTSGRTNAAGTPYVLTLTQAANNYAGGTIVAGPGELKASVAGALGAITAPLTVKGGILDLGGVSQTSGPVTMAGGMLQNGSLNGSSYTGSGGSVSAILAGSAGWTQTSGTTTLSATNTYTGETTITGGTLTLAATGSINKSTQIIIAAGGTFDVSANPTYTAGVNTLFYASGAALPAAIKGGTTVNLGSQPLILTYDGSHPALTVAHGNLSLNGNAVEINGPLLSVGNYTILQQTSGMITAAGSFPPSGTALGLAGTTDLITITNGSMILKVAQVVPVTITGITFASNNVQMSFSATPNYTYLIEAATNLAPPLTWTILSTNTADVSGEFSFIDATATNYPMRFYRTARPSEVSPGVQTGVLGRP